jgi:UMF1 family MFS transporter
MTPKGTNAPPREQFAWAMYDVANSGYTTVVLTTIFNAYFVAGIAGGLGSGTATFLWTLTVALANGVVLFSGPIVGAIADRRASKKVFLMVSTVGCVLMTTALGFIGEGGVALAMALAIGATVMFATGENLIAAFLPEICDSQRMGRLSGYGWGLGYFGGLLTLGGCLGYISYAESVGHNADQYIPVTLWITAAVFALAALPTFLWLNERATPQPRDSAAESYLSLAFRELRRTISQARAFKDLFRFLGVLVVFQSGVSTVIVVAAIYAQEVLGFTSQQLIIMVMVVNITAAVGALGMGHIQDRFGSRKALTLALGMWIAAIVAILLSDSAANIWLAANLIGLAMGSSQAAGRALIGHFTPLSRTGEFFGLWGLAARLAAIVGPASYGVISFATGGNQRLAILSTLLFFVAGLILLGGVNEARGKRAAQEA